jgi:hypothetical protein
MIEWGSLTWRCDICRRERRDEFISVHKVDTSPEGMPPGTVVRRVKYCNDSPDCEAAAKHWQERKRA